MYLTYFFALFIARCLITELVYHLGSWAVQWSNQCIRDICLSGGKENAWLCLKPFLSMLRIFPVTHCSEIFAVTVVCIVIVKGIEGWKRLNNTKIALSWDSCDSQALGIGGGGNK